MTHARMLDATDMADGLYSENALKVGGNAVARLFVLNAARDRLAILCRNRRRFVLIVPVEGRDFEAYTGGEEGNRYASNMRARPVKPEPIALEDAAWQVGQHLDFPRTIHLIPVADVEKRYLSR